METVEEKDEVAAQSDKEVAQQSEKEDEEEEEEGDEGEFEVTSVSLPPTSFASLLCFVSVASGSVWTTILIPYLQSNQILLQKNTCVIWMLIFKELLSLSYFVIYIRLVSKAVNVSDSWNCWIGNSFPELNDLICCRVETSHTIQIRNCTIFSMVLFFFIRIFPSPNLAQFV